MAASAEFMSFLFLLTLFSLQIHARESQFFSKVTSVKSDNVKETTIPNKEETPTKQEQQPAFIPQTQNGYGLYGHETGQLPPAATTSLTSVNGAPYTTTPTNVPYKNEFEDEESLNKFLSSNDDTKKYYNNNNENTRSSYKNSYYSPRENENTYKNNYYSTKENENTRDSYKNSYYSTEENENNNNYFGTKNRYEADLTATKEVGNGYTSLAEQNKYYTGGNRYNGERQGMSDTRYMENGKYYYDVSNEKYNTNQYDNTRGVTPRNWYGNRGYYGNNENSFKHSNSMDGYQNGETFREGQP